MIINDTMEGHIMAIKNKKTRRLFIIAFMLFVLLFPFRLNTAERSLCYQSVLFGFERTREGNEKPVPTTPNDPNSVGVVSYEDRDVIRLLFFKVSDKTTNYEGWVNPPY